MGRGSLVTEDGDPDLLSFSYHLGVPHLCSHPQDQHRNSWQILGRAHRSGAWQGSPPCKWPPGVHRAGRKAPHSENTPPPCPRQPRNTEGRMEGDTIGCGQGAHRHIQDEAAHALPAPPWLLCSRHGLWARVRLQAAWPVPRVPTLLAPGASGELGCPVSGLWMAGGGHASRGWNPVLVNEALCPPSPDTVLWGSRKGPVSALSCGGGMGSTRRQTRSPGGPGILPTASLRVSVTPPPSGPGMGAQCPPLAPLC